MLFETARQIARSTIRLAPPLIVGDAEIADFTRLFGEALAAVA